MVECGECPLVESSPIRFMPCCHQRNTCQQKCLFLRPNILSYWLCSLLFHRERKNIVVFKFQTCRGRRCGSPGVCFVWNSCGGGTVVLVTVLCLEEQGDE